GVDRVVDDDMEPGAVGRRGLGLDEDELTLLLVVLVVEAGVVDDVIAALGLAAVLVGVLDVDRAGLEAEHGCEADERQPAKDRLLAVLRAPATHAGRQIVGTLEGGQFGCSFALGWGEPGMAAVWRGWAVR